MKSFVINRHGSLVLPANLFAQLDFSVISSLAQFEAIVKRDIESKAPSGTEILDGIEAGKYRSRIELLRDVALNLYWVNRNTLTLYQKRPMRWRDVPKNRHDLFLPVQAPWQDADRKIASMKSAFEGLPSSNPQAAASEEEIFGLLFEIVRYKRHHATYMPPIKPTVGEFLANFDNLTTVLDRHDPNFPVFTEKDIVDCREPVPELEAIHRWVMLLHNLYPWDRSRQRLAHPHEIEGDDFVIVFEPRNREVLEFINRVKDAQSAPAQAAAPRAALEPQQPIRPYPPVMVRRKFSVMPKIEALAASPGEQVCTNEDVIRNSAMNWSPMTAEEISSKTGIEARCYTNRAIEEISLDVARSALKHSGRRPEEIGAVLFCSCTSIRLIPSVATWLSAELGIYQTHNSSDIVAACAGMPYGLSEALRILDEVDRPVLLVCAEKFSDKIGNVRTSRMLFGDGAAAMVIAPAPEGGEPDIDIVQTYASGPHKEVNAIVWPNPDFDNNITVYGPPVRALAQRYLTQMLGELREIPGIHGGDKMIDDIDLVVPHQANKTMVTELAVEAGLAPDQLYFNIQRVGNTSAASIPLAIHDAVVEGIIDRPMRLFAPGFGAGAVGGYSVLRIDPAVVAAVDRGAARRGSVFSVPGSSSEDVRVGFGS
ncbi:MAG: 3-oxoacyl-[acyl-carrier-protein] synthase III C-terminal domain-containing protein [Novosphingobium sp.]